MKTFIYYLPPDFIGDLDYETPTCFGRAQDRDIDGEANFLKAIIDSPNAEKYSLMDFILAFNNETISDQGFIAYAEE